jgi:hypothetical protein
MKKTLHTLSPRQQTFAQQKLVTIQQLREQSEAINQQLWELLYSLVPDEIAEGLQLDTDSEQWVLYHQVAAPKRKRAAAKEKK